MIYSIDVLLVKHFFSAEQAGHYAALSLLGKIVFFGATSIGIVMFPKIAEIHSNNKSTKKVFHKSILYTLLISASVVIAYFLFSKIIVNIIFGSQYLEITSLLGLFGLFMLFVSLSYICVLNKLAIGKKKFIFNLLAAVAAEIALISIFHSSLSQIVMVLTAINAVLFISLLKE
jgi:O-antigen/teichoic acid export membrane protein